MRPNPLFLRQPKPFWANVRSISEIFGYTVRGKGQISVPTLDEIRKILPLNQITDEHLVSQEGFVTDLGKTLLDYFAYRAETLNSYVEPLLMDALEAKKLFEGIRKKYKQACPLPLNKQKGTKRAPAYLTGMVNMIISKYAENLTCDFDPRQLTSFTRNGKPLRTFARRVDGAFPSSINPVALWEIKEYYYTTTFGSRVADGVYETLLDGMEIEELREHEGINPKHYLIVDSHFTWWECGRSYLCRILDMLHMGYVDEVLFGKEVVDRLPQLVQEWVRLVKENTN